MKAALCNQYGPPDVLSLRSVDDPHPNNHEALVKVYATTVTQGDVQLRSFNVPIPFWLPLRLMFGIRRPKRPILGMEIAGVVELEAKKNPTLKKGDRVFAWLGLNFGGYAEYACVDEKRLVRMPGNATFEEAAALPVGSRTALSFMRKAGIKTGQKILIYGASGSVGTFAVQIAKCFEAEVTGVCSEGNSELVKSPGAEHVIDYKKEDFRTLDGSYDVIFDAVGKAPKALLKRLLNKKGIYLDVKKENAKEQSGDLEFIKDLMEKGKLRPVIDRIYSLDQIAEAHRYVECGHKKGNVAITIRKINGSI